MSTPGQPRRLLVRRASLGALLVSLLCLAPPRAAGQTPQRKLDRLLNALDLPGVVRSEIGVTRRQTTIPSLLTADDLDYRTSKTRVLLVGGLDGSSASVEAAIHSLRWFFTSDEAKAHRARFALSAVPVANPDGWAGGMGPSNGAGGDPTRGYPPAGNAYSSPTDPEAAYLWRWIGMHAPDLVVELRAADQPGWLVPQGPGEGLPILREHLPAARPLQASGQLAAQLVRASPSDAGPVPAVQLHLPMGNAAFLGDLLRGLVQGGFTGPSPARREIQRRLNRAPLDVAREMARHYGHKLEQVVYIPAMAVIGRLRLGELTNDPSHRAGAEKLARPYVEEGKPSLPENPSGSHFSGHLVFGELAKTTGDSKYAAAARRAADFAFDEQGDPKSAMPAHQEMSDSVFMGCPILAQAGRLTGEEKYYEMSLRHMRFMLRLNLRPDGLHRHSPLDQAAWGRGNGFPALGLALSLSELPEDHPGHAEMLAALRAHLEALLRHQDVTGAWRQVIDFPGSYRELTATCMITFAMARGVRSGWLEEARFRPAIRRAWRAIRTRVASGGGLVDVCTGTGKQRSLRDYLDRTAILGRDDRGGAMALLVATELAYWEKERGPLGEPPRGED